MNLIKRLHLTAATTIALGALAIAPLAASATTGPDESARWFGDVHIIVDDSTDFGLWIEGAGPDSYEAWATCQDGSEVVGEERWAGDPAGSFVYCDSGIAARGWTEYTNS